ncbi:hypothetical protein Pmani_024904 [Petrolisthes manimaculis]|uniref:Uncharacterized protein n=1 Tax=Petrolisthes manimaculis TaxID=1843537 RepID=A0AAE1TPC0_9EUCA|nr:hypothetical protein Pmani_034504 [Petrolisthes manimaculis]KAK4303054.1 hypothetical protein Pmani_024904 [Petrolisthes manimaculis]
MTEAGGSVTVTVRLIRSFEHRNIRNLILRDVDVEISTQNFMEIIREMIKRTSSLPPPFIHFGFDTLKIETQAHGFKTNDPVINRDNDETLILKPEQRLKDCGVKHETEISFFRMEDYLRYKENPELVW